MSDGDYRAALRPIFAGRRAILAMGPAVVMQSWVNELRQLGVERFFLVADGVGTGTFIESADVEWMSISEGEFDMMTAIRIYERTLADPPAEVRRAIDGFDPEGRALVLASHVSDLQALHGRPCFGRRRPAWAALEDKMVCDALWDRAGIPRSPSRVVPAAPEAMVAAGRQLDAGLGTVWAGDNRDGFNGGATYLRWVRGPDDVEEACAFFTARCDRVRVMPFLDGIPCSAHGIIGATQLMVLRPVEMVVFRKPGSNRLVYAGAATYWDPPPEHAAAMRERVRRVGQFLATHYGYRGGYTVDGVMTGAGFLPTELNARAGAALPLVVQGVADRIPIKLIERVLRDGIDLGADVDLAHLERVILATARRERAGGAWTTVRSRFTATTSTRIAWHPDRGAYAPCDGEDAQVAPAPRPGQAPPLLGDATLTIGPSPTGGLVRFSPDAGSLPVGRSVAPRAAAAFALADAIAGTAMGPLEPAPDLHRPG